jgi:hypothetical protein
MRVDKHEYDLRPMYRPVVLFVRLTERFDQGTLELSDDYQTNRFVIESGDSI